MPNKHLQRSRTFAFILYPDEDKLHKFIFDYYSTRETCVWITHDRDLWTDNDLQLGKCTAEEVGTLKKKHIHFLIRFKNPRSVPQFQSDCTFVVSPEDVQALEADLSVDTSEVSEQTDKSELDKTDEPKKSNSRTIHFEVVTSYESMIRYFIHDTIQCVYEHKTKYDVSDLQGDRALIYSALNYEYPFIQDVFSQHVDTILSNNLQFHQFVQYVLGNFPTGSVESQCFYKYQSNFRAICESLRWDNYYKLSLAKKRAVIDDIKSEFQTD